MYISFLAANTMIVGDNEHHLCTHYFSQMKGIDIVWEEAKVQKIKRHKIVPKTLQKILQRIDQVPKMLFLMNRNAATVLVGNKYKKKIVGYLAYSTFFINNPINYSSDKIFL